MVEIQITIENIAPENGIELAPFWLAFHDGSFDAFNLGDTASSAIEVLAEDGITGLEVNSAPFLITTLEMAQQANIDLGTILPAVQSVLASDLDLSTLTPALEALTAANVDLNSLFDAVETLLNSGVDLNTLLPALETLLNSGNEIDLAALQPILQQLSDAGVDVIALAPALLQILNSGLEISTLEPLLQELGNSNIDVATLLPAIETVVNSNFDTSSFLSALEQLDQANYDLNPLIAFLSDPVNSGIDLSSLPPLPGSIADLFANSAAGTNGGVQELVFNNSAQQQLAQPPGDTLTTTITLDDNNLLNTRFFSYAAMLAPSNDAFIANDEPNTSEIFDAQGNFIGADIIILGNQALDGGTEVNDELDTSIPYTVDILFQGQDENGTIQLHPGLNPAGSGGILDRQRDGENVFANADFSAPDYQVARITISEVNSEPEMIVFGDSLSDLGRSFTLTGGAIPPDPPYFQGRFSNGPVAVEFLAPALGFNGDPNNNFAFGGATTGTANTNEDNTGLDLPGLQDQINDFTTLVGNNGADPENLYVVWAGVNDFLDPLSGNTSADPQTIIAQGVTNLVTSVTTLRNLGAENIVVPNLVNLGRLPTSTDFAAQATAVSVAFNSALATAVANLGFEVTLVDLFAIGEAVAANPADFDFSNIDTPLLSLLQAGTPPDNAEEFFFWDAFHPTTQAHQVLGETIRQTVEGETIEPFFFSADLSGDQEVPDAVVSPATGTAQFRLNELGTGLRYNLTVSGLDFGTLAGVSPQTPDTADDVTGLHFHDGTRGVNGDVVFGIVNPNQDDDDLEIVINNDGSTTISGVWEASDAANQPLSNFVDELRTAPSGSDVDLYLNIHTEGSPMGEIRGQITASDDTPALQLNSDNSFVLGGDNETVNLKISLTGVDAANTNEIGIYVIQPNQSLEDILRNGITVFSTPNSNALDFLSAQGFNGNFERILSGFPRGSQIGFYLVANSTAQAVLAGQTSSDAVLLGRLNATSDNGGFSVGLEDGNDGDFNDAQLTVMVTTEEPALGTSNQEIIDLTPLAEQQVQVSINSTGDSAFDNLVGLYLAENDQGDVLGANDELINPGSAGYIQAALDRRVVQFGEIDTVQLNLIGGSRLVPYVLANGSSEDFYSTFFSADGFQHIVSLGENFFGFEDLPNLGDADYNDAVFSITVEPLLA